jgi:hypothetical protein
LSDLQELEQKIREKLEAAEERKKLQQQCQKQRMLEYERRHQRYSAVADRLMRNIVRPRMQRLAAHFDNARFIAADEAAGHHEVCCFQRTLEVSATAKLELAVSHDGPYQQLLLLYNLEIVPVLFAFEGQDKIAMPLDKVDEERAASWFDEKILGFVDTYIRLESGGSWESAAIERSADKTRWVSAERFSARTRKSAASDDPADEAYCLKEASLELP